MGSIKRWWLGPTKPNPLDPEHSAIWDEIRHLRGRVDLLFVTFLAGVVALVVAVFVK